jgi:flagellar biosynthesis/type III secretory pathway chaperone
MKSSSEELVGVMRELSDACRELHAAVEREHAALLSGRLPEMTAAAADKEPLVRRLSDAERRRAALLERMAAELGLPDTALTVAALADRLPADQAGRLVQWGGELRARIARLQAAQERSEALCRGAVDMIQGAQRLLKGFLAGVPVYHGDGAYPAARVSGSLLRGQV